MDLFGTCKTSDAGNNCILTMTDAFTKYTEILAIPSIETITVGDAVFTNWIRKYFYLVIIRTDMCKDFINKVSDVLQGKLHINGSKILQLIHNARVR